MTSFYSTDRYVVNNPAGIIVSGKKDSEPTAMKNYCALDIDSDDEDSTAVNTRQRNFLWGLWMLILFIAIAALSTVLSVTWAVLAFNSEEYKQAALTSVIINVTLLGLGYFLFAFVVIPSFTRLYKSREDPSCCTRSFYVVTLLLTSIVHIGTFVAGYIQAFGFMDPYAIIPDRENNATDTNSDLLLIFRSVAASLNFFSAFCAYILILFVYCIISQNPWRRCGGNGHCVISCTLFNLLIVAVSVFFLLTLQARDYVIGSLSTGVIFGGVFLGLLVLLGLVGGLCMIKYTALQHVNFIRLVWFATGGAGCIALAVFLSQPGGFTIAWMTGFIGAVSILASCCTGCFCYFHLNHGGRYNYITRYTFACFRTGSIRPATTEEYNKVSRKFTETWVKGTCPKVDFVFVVRNRDLKHKWLMYKHKLQDKEVEVYFHGSQLGCHITYTKKLCRGNHLCGICNISSVGMERQYNKKNIKFQRFGPGVYLAPNSSKCHDYTLGAHDYRAMLFCYVCPGKKYMLNKTDQNLGGPPHGYDSIYGEADHGGDLNYPEIVLPDPDAILPRYIILYKKDGVGNPRKR